MLRDLPEVRGSKRKAAREEVASDSDSEQQEERAPDKLAKGKGEKVKPAAADAASKNKSAARCAWQGRRRRQALLLLRAVKIRMWTGTLCLMLQMIPMMYVPYVLPLLVAGLFATISRHADMCRIGGTEESSSGHKACSRSRG